MTVLVRHDPGCKYAREPSGGHSDASKRLSDTYNMHMAALGFGYHGVIAVHLADGRSDNEVYPDRATAMRFQHGHEAEYCYIRLQAPAMTVCEAASVMRYQRQAWDMHKPHLEDGTDLEVIPRLTIEGRERQIRAMRAGGPIALGKGRKQQ